MRKRIDDMVPWRIVLTHILMRKQDTIVRMWENTREKLVKANAVVIYIFLFYRIVSLISGRLLLFVHIVFRTSEWIIFRKHWHTPAEISANTIYCYRCSFSFPFSKQETYMLWHCPFDVISPTMRRFPHDKYVCSLVEYRVSRKERKRGARLWQCDNSRFRALAWFCQECVHELCPF